MSFERVQQLTENPVALHREMSTVIPAGKENKRVAPTISSAVVLPYTSTTGSSGPLHQTWTYAQAVVAIDHADLYPSDFEKQPEILLAQRELSAIDPDYRPSNNEVAAAAGVTLAQVIRVLASSRYDRLSYS